MNPSSQTVRGVTLAPIGRKTTQAPQNRSRVAASEPRRSIMDPGRLAPIGRQPTLEAATGSVTISMQTPSITKRNGYDSIVTQGNSKRAKVDLGGNNAIERAALRASQLGRDPRVPVFDDSQPRLNQMYRGPSGLPVAGNMPGFRNPLPMGVNYSRTVGPENIIFEGLRQPLPSVATMSPATGPSGLAGTSTTNQFMQRSDGVARLGSNPVPAELFNVAAGDIEKKTKSGSPNARVTYTHKLNEMAAAYAGVGQEKTVWVIPIVFEEGGMGADIGTSSLFHWGVDIEHAGYNLSIANYMLAISQSFPKNFAEVMTAQMILTNFRLGGVVAAEEGATKTQYVDKADSNIHRNIVFTVQGPANVFNYWGDVKYQSTVGFIVKGVPLKNIFAHHYLDAGSYNIDAVEPAAIRALNKTALSNNPLQFVPWFDSEGMSDRPGLEELEYVDDYGCIRLGIFIPIGTVMQVYGEVANQDHIDRAWVSAAAAVSSGMLQILVNTQDN
jgi:hypothetical protein